MTAPALAKALGRRADRAGKRPPATSEEKGACRCDRVLDQAAPGCIIAARCRALASARAANAPVGNALDPAVRLEPHRRSVDGYS